MRLLLKIVPAVLLIMTAVPSFADEASAVAAVSEELRDQGYTVETISHTFWGRVRIVADKNDLEREVILNPYTGEILRDLVRHRRDHSAGSDDASPAVTNNDVGDSNEQTEDSGASEADQADSPDEPDSSDESDSPDSGGTED
jgi:hypothetical protein